MKRRNPIAKAWAEGLQRGWTALARSSAAASRRASARPAAGHRAQAQPGGPDGQWIAGLAMGSGGARRFRLYRPAGLGWAERVPLLVMLHGCGQDADSFARSTRMNTLARRERFMVLYPEQDRMANLQRCWNWFDTRSGRAQAEADLVMKAIDQACLLYPVDPGRVAVAGLSAGASLAALLAMRHPQRFKAVVMHSGVAPGSADSALTAIGAMQGRGGGDASPASACAGAPAWPALLVIHGSADPVVAPANAHTAAARWAAAAGALPGPARGLQRGHRLPATVTDYQQRGRPVATLVEVTGLGHGWSGAAAGQPHGDARGPDASRMVWAFAARQFRG